MSNYTNLRHAIEDDHSMTGCERTTVEAVLGWLDRNPDQVPGRAITESDYQKIIDETSVPYGVGFTDGFHQAGGSITPDPEPEPTEAEKLAKIISEYTYNSEPQALAEALVRAGVKAPEGEPTNAGHDRDWWVENANVNDAEDCEACEGDLCPVHYGVSMGIDLMAKKIAALGDDPELFALIPDPVTAPGGES